MPTFDAATDQPEYVLPEPGAYIATCIRIEDAPDKGFGPGVKWVFTLTDPKSGVTFLNAEGEPAELWQWTSVKMSPKARARPIVEALLGRELNVDGREVPDVRELIGKSMTTLVIHEKRDDGSDTARVTSCKPYVSSSTPPQPSMPPPAAGAGLTLREQIQEAIRKAHILGSPRHLEWLALTPQQLDMLIDANLQSLLAEINADILAG